MASPGASWRGACACSSAAAPALARAVSRARRPASIAAAHSAMSRPARLDVATLSSPPRRRASSSRSSSGTMPSNDASFTCGTCCGAGADRRTAVAHRARRLDHDAAEVHDGDVARAEALARAVGDRSHRLPHRHVLVRDADDAGVAAALHRLRDPADSRCRSVRMRRKSRVEVDADARPAEFAPRLLRRCLRRRSRR